MKRPAIRRAWRRGYGVRKMQWVEAVITIPSMMQTASATASTTSSDPVRKRVLVIGATGMLGRPVARVLDAEGHRVRCLVRDLEKARSLLPETCEFARGDLRDPSTIERAMADCDAVYTNLAEPMVKDEPEWNPDLHGMLHVIDAAKKTGVPHVLRISALGVPRARSEWWVVDHKARADEALEKSGLTWTVFRPTWFTQSIPLNAIGPKLIVPQTPDAKLYWLDASDYARLVAASLLDPRAHNQAMDVQGPEGLSMKEAYGRFHQVWKKYLWKVPGPRFVLKMMAPMIGPAAYIDALLDYTYRHCTSLPQRSPANEIHEPRNRVEDVAKRMLQEGDLPRKGLKG